jgi:hypothetical protein
MPQTQTMACWYASAQMLIAWRRNRTKMTERTHPDPSEVPGLQSTYAANTGLPAADFVALARQLGLTPVPPMTPTLDSLSSWLRSYGPLWFAGLFPAGSARSNHVVVVTGIDDTALYINDPWPPNVGRQYSISFSSFGEDLRPVLAGGALMPNLLYFSE